MAMRVLYVLSLSCFLRAGGFPPALLSVLAALSSLTHLSLAGCGSASGPATGLSPAAAAGAAAATAATMASPASSPPRPAAPAPGSPAPAGSPGPSPSASPRGGLWFLSGLVRLEELDLGGWQVGRWTPGATCARTGNRRNQGHTRVKG